MSTTLVTVAAWLAVMAVTVSAVLFGQGARFPNRRPRDRSFRIGIAMSISGPIGVVLIAILLAAASGAWLLFAIIAFAAVCLVCVIGLVLAPH